MDAGAVPVSLKGKNERVRSRPQDRGPTPGMAGSASLPPYWDRTSGGAGGDTGSHV
jgi:hypothetical protein